MGINAFRKAGITVYFLILVNILAPGIRIRIINTDPDFDPGKPNQCGPGSQTLGSGTNRYEKTPPSTQRP